MKLVYTRSFSADILLLASAWMLSMYVVPGHTVSQSWTYDSRRLINDLSLSHGLLIGS